MATAAVKFNQPVRCMLDRDEDMIHSGTRHPFLAKYKVGFNGNGRINSGSFIISISASILKCRCFSELLFSGHETLPKLGILDGFIDGNIIQSC